MELRLKDAASFIGGKLIGDENLIIKGLAKIDEAKKETLLFSIFLHTKNTFLILKPLQ